MIRDLRHAVRVLLQAKGWTGVVLISLALGIGANVALFSAVNGLLLQTISASRPDELVRFGWYGDNDMARSRSEYGFGGELPSGERRNSTFSYPTFLQLEASNQTLAGLLACAPWGRANVVIDGQAEMASAFLASGSYFEVLGVGSALGRTITENDDRPSAPPVAMLSHGYWKRRFGLSADTVGKSIEVNNVTVTIVGVTQEGYGGVQGPEREVADVHLPLSLYPSVTGEELGDGTSWWVQIMGRLNPDTTAAQVRGNFEGVFRATARESMSGYLEGLSPEDRSLARNQDRTAVPDLWVDSGRRGVYDPSPRTTRDVRVLSAVVVLVLLIVCANVANLLLSRATSRHQELSIRQSMGATSLRLVRQLLTESLLLSLVGGALGLVVALWARSLLPFGQSAPLDWRVFAFVAALSLLTGVAFSLIPALRATGELASSLKEGSRGVLSSRSLLSKGLLVVQVAVSIVLLMGAGLFLSTLRNLRSVDVGFDPTNILLFRVNPALVTEDELVPLLYDQMRERLEAIPGVESVSLSRSAFLSGSVSTRSVHLPDSDSEESLSTHFMSVSGGFFETLGIPLISGRVFAPGDTEEAPQVAILNAAAAREFLGQGTPVGRRLGWSAEKRSELEIVGVVGDVKYSQVREAAPPTIYVPYTQHRVSSMVFEVKTAGDPNQLVPSVREAIRSVDPKVPLMDVSTQTEQIDNRFRQERFFAIAYSAFGGLAALLAAIGLFGLASYGVAQRTNEIGVRMALGANRGDVVRMVVTESLVLVAVGVAIGIVGALVGGRLVSNLLFDVAPANPVTMAAATIAMILVSSIAAFFPARLAARIDPMSALHYE